MRLSRVHSVAAVIGASLLSAPGSAVAGTYEVSLCTRADNTILSSDGWTPFDARFRRTLVKARYRFQARLVAQPGYPYRGATSRRVSVVVSP